MSNFVDMTYNVVEDLGKLRTTLPFNEVVKIPQQRENILILLNDPSKKKKSLLQVRNKSRTNRLPN
jgi:hypothetical protein